MRLDELKNDFPDIPDFIHDMIQEEVEKQVNSSNITPMQRKSKLNRSISGSGCGSCVHYCNINRCLCRNKALSYVP